MPITPYQVFLVLLVAVAYLMAYCMMRVLSSALYHEARIHDRICEAREMRRRFFDATEEV